MGWIWHLCIVNMKRRRTRTILTILGVVIGVISVVTLLAIGIGVRQEMINQAVDSDTICQINVYGVTSGKHKDRMITDQTVEAFRSIDDVASAYPVYSVSVELTSGKYTCYGELTGIPKEQLAAFTLTDDSGEIDSTVKPVIVMGDKMASLFYNEDTEESYDTAEKKDVTSMIGKSLSAAFWDVNLQTKLSVAAVIDSGDNAYDSTSQSMYCDIDVLKNYMTRMSQDGVIAGQPLDENGNAYREFVYTSAVVTVDSLDHVDAVVKKLQDNGYQTENEKEYLDTIQKYLKMVQLLLGGIGMIALVVAVIGISNTMTTSVYDRINEIGILKVLGCDPDELRILFLIEAGVIGAVGGVLGVAVSYAFKTFVDKLGVRMFDLAKGTHIAVIPWWLAVSAVVGAAILAICAGYFPARFAAKLAPMDAVRSR